ncbi:MAG: Nif11-like leader peptide family natural product precursor [Xenococcaceae cyanobacterium]|jgi:predicted ribosomally synthesized peptide with nif11-like leader
MSLENVRDFYSRLATDEAFRARISIAENKNECTQIVEAAGFDFTPEEFEQYTSRWLQLNQVD